ncbi:L domain-like protein [Anaeromyces robustus]|uniref:L domain-like protein n=1 Tax=Anaeromyces robustus TaxID=1754192 RepID=A0A1Y1X0S5_9FUNG|nr:L domain-like protein [Anaeromyces robustus]|eukprot:ORX79312.1 L domain-like protein [Anaeromyces robustus]
MNLKFILKALSISLVTPFVSATETNDCNEIKDYLEKNSFEYEKVIEKCVMNDQGKVVELKVNNEELQEEDVNKILSYNTIKDLEYIVGFKFSDEQDTPYSYVLLPHPGYSQFPKAITNLPELENLNFNYNHHRYIKYYPEVVQIPVEDGLLKLSKNLKKLTLSKVTLNSQNLNELSTLTNLEEINFDSCVFDENDLSSFENLKNLLKLDIKNLETNEQDIPNNINKIKSLRQLYIGKVRCKETSYDFNGLDNLELLNIELRNACDFELSNLNKLYELSIVGPNSFVYTIGIQSPISLNLPKSLKKLDLEQLTFSSDNYKTIASLPDLEELKLIYYGSSDAFDIKSFESHDKLRKLTLNSNYCENVITNDNSGFLNDLTNLTYLDLSSNKITEIPQQIENLKNLEHIDLRKNKISKFSKELPNLKNLEYIDLSSNYIYDTIPDSLSKLEKLNYIDLSGNKDIKGKVLTNKSLEQYINKVKQVECSTNEQGRATTINFLYGEQIYIDQLDNISDLESLTMECMYNIDNLKPLRHHKNLTTLIMENRCDSGDQVFPEDILYLTNLKTLQIPSKSIDSIPVNIKNLKNLETLNLRRNSLKELPDEFGELENLKSLNLESNEFTVFPEQITKLKNLEELNLIYNSIDDEIPKSYNDLSELKDL